MTINNNKLQFSENILAEIEVWQGTYAPEIETALKDFDFTGKTIRIITTHEEIVYSN